MANGLLINGLAQGVLVYENKNFSSVISDTTSTVYINAAGVATIAVFAAANGSYSFEPGNTIRLLGASPVQQWVYIGGDKSDVNSYVGPILESYGGAGTKTAVIINDVTGSETIAHDDSNYYILNVFNDPGGTTLTDITGVIERYPTVVGTIRVNNPNARPFLLGTALDPDTSDTQVIGWYKTVAPFDTEQYIDYYRAGGKLVLEFRETGKVEAEG